jgi:hypothetical protein
MPEAKDKAGWRRILLGFGLTHMIKTLDAEPEAVAAAAEAAKESEERHENTAKSEDDRRREEDDARRREEDDKKRRADDDKRRREEDDRRPDDCRGRDDDKRRADDDRRREEDKRRADDDRLKKFADSLKAAKDDDERHKLCDDWMHHSTDDPAEGGMGKVVSLLEELLRTLKGEGGGEEGAEDSDLIPDPTLSGKEIPENPIGAADDDDRRREEDDKRREEDGRKAEDSAYLLSIKPRIAATKDSALIRDWNARWRAANPKTGGQRLNVRDRFYDEDGKVFRFPTPQMKEADELNRVRTADSTKGDDEYGKQLGAFLGRNDTEKVMKELAEKENKKGGA